MQSFTTKIKTQKTTVFYYIRVFTFLVYFSIRLYIYIYLLKKKKPYIRLFILHHILLKYDFLINFLLLS